jgi:RNA recognition motif-containing protein
MTSIQSSLSSLASTPSLASQPSPSIDSESDSVSPGLKTPNVYINGLPPNFPEESLLEMTKPFGEVISVRTFTRHVSDKPS